ncbi:hypothetical protein [Pelosinus baikalensis]|uniref:Uncharacterized protein n=1 Tax=Pelosinus baikalensis TaxID=2892015 RepID=A0ABS8HY61_9FIRM|nr:hypothetical protein [Pelosinus baikalensis]MCC5466914.1 hypothetical protein [Pelosinus baikalensis]
MVTVKGRHSAFIRRQPKTSSLVGQKNLQLEKTNQTHLGKLMINNVKIWNNLVIIKEKLSMIYLSSRFMGSFSLDLASKALAWRVKFNIEE